MKPTMQSIASQARESAAFCGILGAAWLAVSFSAMGQVPSSSLFPLPPPVVSTVPSNGDVNPYGVAFVPEFVLPGGELHPGDILVSNFNNSQNLQGTGTTIVRVGAHGDVTTFYQGKNLGLTAALGVLHAGVVLVGNLPTTDGTSATVKAGSLLALDRNGNLIGTLANTSLVNGPWGMAIQDWGNFARIFVSNVLSGTIARIDLAVMQEGESVILLDAVTIASGYNHRLDPAALVLGPSGLFYDADNDILYVASSADNAIYAINGAGALDGTNQSTGTVIYQDNMHLHGPIDLVRTPTGHMIVANSDGSNVDPNQPSELVEFTLEGQFIAEYSVDKNNGGAFGVGVKSIGETAVRVAAVDDNANTLSIFIEPIY